MTLIFRLLAKEKKWLIILLLCLVPAAFSTVGQFLVYAGFTQVIMQADRDSQKKKKKRKTIRLTRLSPVDQVRSIGDYYRRHGQRKTISLILNQESYYFILLFGGIFIIILLLNQLFLYLKDFTLEYFGERIAKHVRQEFFCHMIMLPSSFYKENRSGDIISRSINDIEIIRLRLPQLLEIVVYCSIVLLVGITILVLNSLRFTVVLMGTTFLTMIVVAFLSTLLRKVLQHARERQSDINSYMQKIIFGIDIIKIFNQEKREKSRFLRLIEKYLFLTKQEKALEKLSRPINEFFGALGILGILLYGAHQIWGGVLSMDKIINFVVLTMMIAPVIQKMAAFFMHRQDLLVSTGRIEEVLNNQIEVHKEMSHRLNDFSGRITINGLSYRYPGTTEDCLHDVHLTAAPGSMTAIVGPSGGGKSTLINLIARFISPTAGTIYFDDLDTGELGVDDVRSVISLVSQESILFPGTVLENVQYGKLDASPEEIADALQMADIYDFVQGLPQKEHTTIGERGLKLSGGQKQRLCIARAILKRPKILLLDEATSALDTHSEKSVQRAIDNLANRQTTFIVAHRLSTIQKAKQVIVIDRGRIVEQGTHDDLLRADGLFKQLHRMQFEL